MRRAVLGVVGSACFVLALAGTFVKTSAQTTASTPAPGSPFTILSTDIEEGAPIGKKFAGPSSAQLACGGENISPALKWSNPPANTKSFAVVMFDFEGGRGSGVVHWIAYGIGPDVTSLATGEGSNASPHLIAGTNTRQTESYFGPCAPATDMPHHYIYSVYALDVAKDELPSKLTRDQFLEKVKGRILNLTSIVATYRRP